MSVHMAVQFFWLEINLKYEFSGLKDKVSICDDFNMHNDNAQYA